DIKLKKGRINMSLLPSYRNTAARKRKEISKLNSDKANQQKRLSDISSKIQRVSQMLSNAKSSSTIKSKSREIERKQKEAVLVEKKIADIETKMARKHKDLDNLLNKIAREEKKEFDKRQKEEEKRTRELNNTINQHDMLLNKTMSDVEELKRVPDEITVLFFASNPLDQKQLRLDEEVREIQEMIRKTKHRDSVNLESCWAVRPGDVIQAINEKSPAVVHFSGHGSDNDEIILQDEMGGQIVIQKTFTSDFACFFFVRRNKLISIGYFQLISALIMGVAKWEYIPSFIWAVCFLNVGTNQIHM
ncbi:MAG: hypothetical protein WDZ80_04595, partial [Candidatus Paceibacterota bacterium]